MVDFISPTWSNCLWRHKTTFNNTFVGTIHPTYNVRLTSILLHDQLHQGLFQSKDKHLWKRGKAIIIMQYNIFHSYIISTQKNNHETLNKDLNLTNNILTIIKCHIVKNQLHVEGLVPYYAYKFYPQCK